MTNDDALYAIKVLRPLFIVAICLVHMPFIAGYTASYVEINDLNTLLGPFIKNTFARSAVPMLTVASGFLAYHSYQRSSYGVFVKKKIQRILVPFVAWNILLGILFYLSYKNIGFPALGAEIPDWTDSQLLFVTKIMYGYSGFPINGPTYFLRDLFLVSLLTPVFIWLIKPQIIWPCLFGFTILFITTPFVGVAGDAPHYLFYRTDMILFFYIGCCLSHYNFAPDQSWFSKHKCLACLIFFLSVCVLSTIYLVHQKPDIMTYVHVRPMFGLLFLILIPCTVSAISRYKRSKVVSGLAAMSIYSYTLFFVNYPAAVVLTYIVDRFALHVDNRSSLISQSLMIFAYLVLCFVLTFLVAHSYWALRKALLCLYSR